MNIVIDQLPDGRFMGVLSVDGDQIYKTIEKRPGCCARNILNHLSITYGKPSGSITLEVDGW